MSIKKNKKGFTLVETLISILILAILLAGGMSFYFNSSDFMALAMHKKMALELATEKMEECKRVTTLSALDALDNNPTPGPESISVGGLSATRTTDVSDPGNGESGYRLVEVNVVWTEAGKNTSRNVDLITYIHK